MSHCAAIIELLERERKNRMSLNAWFNLAPANDKQSPGVQIMVPYQPGKLQDAVRVFLVGIGATAKVEEHRYNQEAPVRHRDGYGAECGEPTGLVLRIFPCYRTGGNVDVDPIEPRGE